MANKWFSSNFLSWNYCSLRSLHSCFCSSKSMVRIASFADSKTVKRCLHPFFSASSFPIWYLSLPLCFPIQIDHDHHSFPEKHPQYLKSCFCIASCNNLSSFSCQVVGIKSRKSLSPVCKEITVNHIL